MIPIGTATDIAGTIGLAVAPVFLLTGIAGFLNVLSGRLGRVVDRARVVEKRLEKNDDAELKILWKRVRLIHWSIGLCTVSGLLICVLTVSLFLGGFWAVHIGGLIVGLFVLGLLILIIALLLFLMEVRLAISNLRLSRDVSVE